MSIHLRRGRPADAAVAGEICYRSFKVIAEAHNFPPDMPSAAMSTQLLTYFLGNEKIFGVVAELDEKVVGSNFLDERNPICGVGPITVEPTLQNEGVGRALMRAVMQRSDERGFAGI